MTEQDKQQPLSPEQEAELYPLPTATRYLDPSFAKVHLGNHGVLHVTIMNERIFGGVHAQLIFPVQHPEQYISLRHTNSQGQDMEVGIIRDLSDWPDQTQALVRESLKRRYFVHVITQINDIAWKWGFIGFDVQTNKGPREFLMRWQGDRAVSFGQRGKVLLDVDENRYLIPDLEALPPKERSLFMRFIYW